jgi:Ca-activated chloride channel homolog
LNAIANFNADMGGTEILDALWEIFKVQSIPDYPTNIFILTDGAVDSPDNLIKFVEEKKSGSVRVYTLGIGDGGRKYLIEKTAVIGNGLYEYVDDNEDINEKVIGLL